MAWKRRFQNIPLQKKSALSEMLGIIVCQLQPSKSTFELIKENFLFICFSVVLLYFWPRQNKTSKLWQPRKDKKLWFSALSPPYARDYFRVKEHKYPDPRGREGREKRRGNRGEGKGPSPLTLVLFPGGVQYSHTLPIRVCAAQQGRDFEAPDLERGIHFRGVF